MPHFPPLESQAMVEHPLRVVKGKDVKGDLEWCLTVGLGISGWALGGHQAYPGLSQGGSGLGSLPD